MANEMVCLNCGHPAVCHEEAEVRVGLLRYAMRVRCNHLTTLRAKWADHDREDKCPCDSDKLALAVTA